MKRPLEVPLLEDLWQLGMVVEPREDEVGVVLVTTWASDGSRVVLSWDEIASSVSISWFDDDVLRVSISRETADRVTINKKNGKTYLCVESSSEGVFGRVDVEISETVTLHEFLLEG